MPPKRSVIEYLYPTGSDLGGTGLDDVSSPEKWPHCGHNHGTTDPQPTSRHGESEPAPGLDHRPRLGLAYRRERLVRPATTRYAAVSTTRARMKRPTWRAASVLARTSASST